ILHYTEIPLPAPSPSKTPSFAAFFPLAPCLTQALMKPEPSPQGNILLTAACALIAGLIP
ncbi:MAG TPA: hypothetical protein VMO20_02465, partial [Candidatus Acidoferrum sp.]|nr:hypothetical protein [Candidatus Acidoferrum sp.]